MKCSEWFLVQNRTLQVFTHTIIHDIADDLNKALLPTVKGRVVCFKNLRNKIFPPKTSS